MRWIVACLIVGLLMAAPLAAQEAEEDVGPRVYFCLGVENPNGEGEPTYDGRKTSSADLLLRSGIGIEFPGVMGNRDTYFAAEYLKTGWGDTDTPDQDRWHYVLKQYINEYWGELHPFLAFGLEHQGKSFAVNQVNRTYFAVGIEPPVPGGWFRVNWEAVNWLMEDPNQFRFLVDFIPRS